MKILSLSTETDGKLGKETFLELHSKKDGPQNGHMTFHRHEDESFSTTSMLLSR